MGEIKNTHPKVFFGYNYCTIHQSITTLTHRIILFITFAIALELQINLIYDYANEIILKWLLFLVLLC